MTTYYIGMLPQGASIVYQRSPEHTYTLPASKTLCFPFKIPQDYNQVVVDAADTTPFESAFIPGSRAWASDQPVGMSLTAAPFQTQSSPRLYPNGVRWNFWLKELNNKAKEPSEINHIINADQTYYMNIQNLQNRQSYFFLRFTFYGNGVTFAE